MKIIKILILLKIFSIATVLVIYNYNFQKLDDSLTKELLIFDINFKFLPFLILSIFEFFARNKMRILIVFMGFNIVLLVCSFISINYFNYPIIFFDFIICSVFIILNQASKKKIVREPSCWGTKHLCMVRNNYKVFKVPSSAWRNQDDVPAQIRKSSIKNQILVLFCTKV